MDITTLYRYFAECHSLTTDTRRCTEGAMFVALQGATFDGNAFARQALANGCRYAVIDNPAYADAEEPRLLLVDNALEALQVLARHHRRLWGKTVIGITGTNGKTTTKELIATVLEQRYNLLYTQGNLNNHIGVPLTLLNLRPEHELAVIEMGANHPGEIDTLAHIAEPDCGLITNVGKAHLEGFGSFEGVVRTKGELYDYLRLHGTHTVFVPKENSHLHAMTHGLQCVYYGQTEGLFVSGTPGACTPCLDFRWTHAEQSYHVSTHLIGTYNLDNALAAIAVGLHFGIAPQQICRALESYIPRNHRSQLEDTGRNRLIVDAYNANPTSMMAALQNFEHMDVPHKTVILGDMKELGDSSAEEHQRIVDFLATCHFEHVVLVGEAFGATRHTFAHYPDAETLITALDHAPVSGSYILIKGSNSMKLVQLVAHL